MTARPVRWLLAVVASMVTFGLCLWAVSAVSARWLPEGEEARWGVLAAFAGVAAAAVGGAVGWWAAQDGADPSANRQRIDQEADVTDDGDVVQIAGDAGAGAPRSDGGPGSGLSQRAKASGNGRVVQVGGDHGRRKRRRRG